MSICKDIYEIVPNNKKCDIEMLLMHNFSRLNKYDQSKICYEKSKTHYDNSKIRKFVEYMREIKWIKCLIEMERLDEAKEKYNTTKKRFKEEEKEELTKQERKFINEKLSRLKEIYLK